MTAGGGLKDGGTANFAVNGVKPTHPIKPLVVAQTLFNALSEDGSFEAQLVLGFGKSGRTGIEAQLRSAADAAPDDVFPTARFESPVEVVS